MSKQLTNYTDVKKLENLDILEAIEFKSKSKEDILEVKIYSGRRLIRTYNKTKIIEGLLVIEPIILSACSIHRIEITTSPIIDESEIIFHQSILDESIKRGIKSNDTIINTVTNEIYIGGLMGKIDPEFMFELKEKIYGNFYIALGFSD